MIADIHIRTWQSAYAHAFPADELAALDERRAERERFWREWLENPPPAWNVLVAEQAERVVGFVSAGRERNDESLGEVYAIYVLPEAWGGGAGRALIAEALEHLRRNGFEHAVLWVLEDNPRARAFYEREGWRLDGESREETFLGTSVREVRYRIRVDAPRRAATIGPCGPKR